VSIVTGYELFDHGSGGTDSRQAAAVEPQGLGTLEKRTRQRVAKGPRDGKGERHRGIDCDLGLTGRFGDLEG